MKFGDTGERGGETPRRPTGTEPPPLPAPAAGAGGPPAPSPALGCECVGSKPPAQSKFLPLSALSPSRERSFCREQTLAIYLGVTDSPPECLSGSFQLNSVLKGVSIHVNSLYVLEGGVGFFFSPFAHHSLEPSKQHGLGAFTPLQTYIGARLQSRANPYNNIALSGKMKSKGGPRREVKRSRDAMQARRPFVWSETFPTPWRSTTGFSIAPPEPPAFPGAEPGPAAPGACGDRANEGGGMGGREGKGNCSGGGG